MTWGRSGSILVGCVAVMALTAKEPGAGAGVRWAFVAAALLGCWAWWRLISAKEVSLRAVIGLAVVCRLLLFPVLPSLSDDGYRYVWDGMLLAQEGISPYAYTPDDPVLGEIQSEEIYSRLNSKRYYSVYPVVSQSVFWLGGLVYGRGWEASWFVIKGALVLFEAVGIALLARVYSARGVAVYALHPLALLEVAGQAHTEAILVAALALCLVMARHSTRLGAAIAFAGWVKLFPFGLAVVLGARWRGWLAFAAVLAVGLPFVLYQGGLLHILESVALYGGTLDFYAAPFLALKSALYPLAGSESGPLAARLLTVVWGGVLLWLFWQRWTRPGETALALALGVTSYALLSPMQHPWNWIGVLAIIPLLQTKIPVVWVLSLSLLTYLRYVSGDLVYHGAIAVGWGGGAFLLWRSVQDGSRMGDVSPPEKWDR